MSSGGPVPRGEFPDPAFADSGRIAVETAPGARVVGHLDPASGRMATLRDTGPLQVLGPNSAVLDGDTLFGLGERPAGIVFADGTRLAIAGHGRVVAETVRTDPDGSLRLSLSVSDGTFTLVPAGTGEGAGSGVVVATPAARVRTGGAAIVVEHSARGGLEVRRVDDGTAAVVVENAHGRIDVPTPQQAVVVAGAGAAPEVRSLAAGEAEPESGPADTTAPLAPMLASLAGDGAAAAEAEVLAAGGEAEDADAPEGELEEMSPGGDENALPGDPIVVTGVTATFDLRPQAAPLGAPSLAPITPGWSSVPVWEHDGLPVQQGFADGGVEFIFLPGDGRVRKQLRDWEPQRRLWDVEGEADTLFGQREMPFERPLRLISPTERGATQTPSMAMLEARGGGLQDIETFLGLPAGAFFGAFPGAWPVEGSAIRSTTSFTLAAGQEISFDFFFDAVDSITGDRANNDSAYVVLDGLMVMLADVAGTGDLGATGWRTFVYRAPAPTSFEIGFAVIDDADPDDSSRLFLDNVLFDRSVWTSDDFRLLDAHSTGRWGIFAPRPVAGDDFFTVSADAIVAFSAAQLMANDVDPDLFDAMVIRGFDRSGAIARIVGTGGDSAAYDSVTYDPTRSLRLQALSAGEVAEDRFQYVLDGGNGQTRPGTVHVTVVGVNDAPFARTDRVFAVGEDAPSLTLTQFADDYDNDDDWTSLVVSSASAQFGSVVAASSGARLTYAPAGGFEYLAAGETATDTLSYTVRDRYGASTTASLQVTITGANDAPIGGDDVIRIGQDEVRTIGAADVLANDRDPDRSDRLDVVDWTTDGPPEPGAVLSATTDGLVYDPRGVWASLGLGETAVERAGGHYTLTDGTIEATARVTIEIVGVNDAPTAGDDVAQAAEDGPGVFIDVLANDDDVDGYAAKPADRDSLRVVEARAASGAAVTIGEGPRAPIVYDPAGRFESLAEGETATDTITYHFEDQHGARAEGIVRVTVVGRNDAPVAGDDTIADATEDAPLVLSLLDNDDDVDDSDVLRVIEIDGEPIAAGGWVELASGARVGLDAEGRPIYDPNGRFEHLQSGVTATDSFRYRIGDGHDGGTAEATATVTINGNNDAPVARAAVSALPWNEDRPADPNDPERVRTIDVLANVTDVDAGDLLRVTSARAASGAEVNIQSDGSLRYLPYGHFQWLGAGETATDTITYIISDGSPDPANTATGTVTVTVVGANDAPEAFADTLHTTSDTKIELSALLGLLSNDTEVDRTDELTVRSINGSEVDVGSEIELAQGGLLTVGADGGLSYDPRSAAALQGIGAGEYVVETFRYTVADKTGATSEATVDIRILGRNDPPEANADVAVTDADAPVRINVLANDTDPDATDTRRIAEFDVVSERGARVTLDWHPDPAKRGLTYDPDGRFADLRPGETVTDTFRYVIEDFLGLSSEAVVTVTIHGVAGPPDDDQVLLQSYEGPLSSNDDWGILGSVAQAVDYREVDGARHLALPTHANTLAVLRPDPAVPPVAVLHHLGLISRDDPTGQVPLASLPLDSGHSDSSAPVAGSALKGEIRVQAGDVVSFDWFFDAREPILGDSTVNDYAVFTVSDASGTSRATAARLFELTDVRQTGSFGASGWRTSTFTVGNDLMSGTPARILTIGFAVLEDESTAAVGQSRLLIDNVRLNRDIGSEHELLSAEGGGAFATWRERPTVTDDVLPPAASPGEDSALTITAATLLANDAVSAGADPASLRIVGIDAADTLGQVSLVAGGVVYDPRGALDHLAQGETGVDRFAYLVTDANGGTGRAQVIVTVTGVNDAPRLADDAVVATENGAAVAIDPLGNDDDVDSDDDRSSLRIVSASATSGAAIAVAGLAGAGIVYRPDSVAAFDALGADETGTDTITYVVEDRHGAQSTATIRVTVHGRNDAPIAAADTGVADEDEVYALRALANDVDPDTGDRLAILAVDGREVAPGGQVTLASGAVVTLGADGALHWDPRGSAGLDALGRGAVASERFTYTVGDGHGGSSTAAVTLTVAGRNDAPVAAPDAAVATGRVLSVAAATLLDNDRDPDLGDALSIVGVDALSEGRYDVRLDAGTVHWEIPEYAYAGLGEGEQTTYSFGYRVADRDGALASGRVSVTVHGVNDAPIGVDDRVAVDADGTTTLHVAANDRDIDGNDVGMLWVHSLDTTGTRGTVRLNPDGSVTYDARGGFADLAPGQTAVDRFSYRVADGHGGFDDAEVVVTVTGTSAVEQLVESFEATLDRSAYTTTHVARVGSYQETDGARGSYTPTDGATMIRMEANGTPAIPVGSDTISRLEAFLGIPNASLPRDTAGTGSGEPSGPINGSAFRFMVDVGAGEEISFDWMFDSRDSTRAPADRFGDNDFAVMVVDGPAPGSIDAQIFKLADVRGLAADQGASGWRSSIYTAETAGTLTIGIAVVNDRSPSPQSQNSVLLVDNIRINRDFDDGYQLVDSQMNGRFETVELT